LTDRRVTGSLLHPFRYRIAPASVQIPSSGLKAGVPSWTRYKPYQARTARGSAVGADDADRAGHAGAVVGTVPVRVLGVRQVLLVVVLGGG
jgi:hypothetical protein